MLYIRELCNLNDDEADVLIEAAGKSLQNSEYTLMGGTPSSHFFDIDLFLREGRNAEKLVDLLISKIKKITASDSYGITKIALIDKGEGGPLGLVSILSELAKGLEEELLLIRPKKLLLKAAIKGNIATGDKVLILSDVATTGRTIFKAAEKLVALGATAPATLVVFDRRQGATENLGMKGIQLFSLTSTVSLKEEKEKELKAKYRRGIKDSQIAPIYIDFGGRSVTNIL